MCHVLNLINQPYCPESPLIYIKSVSVRVCVCVCVCVCVAFCFQVSITEYIDLRSYTIHAAPLFSVPRLCPFG